MRLTTFHGHHRARVAASALVAAGLLLAACGGSSSGGTNGGAGGGGGGGGTTPTQNGTIGGTATKGPIADATVTAFAVMNGAKGAQLATARTGAQGQFTMQMGTYSGPVLVELRGGTYIDEATNATMPMASGDVMTAVVPGFAAGSSATVMVTPLTGMAQTMAQGMAGGMTDANITAANGRVGSYFDVDDILHTMPMDPLAAGSGSGASQAMKNYGMSLAAMSQYAKTIGMTTSSSAMVTAMMDDASDGVMDGMMGSTPIAMGGMGGMMMGGTMMPHGSGTSGLATAMRQFVDSTMNRSGVSMTEMQPLVAKLGSSTGAIQ